MTDLTREREERELRERATAEFKARFKNTPDPSSTFVPPPRFCSYCGAWQGNGEFHSKYCDRTSEVAFELLLPYLVHINGCQYSKGYYKPDDAEHHKANCTCGLLKLIGGQEQAPNSTASEILDEALAQKWRKEIGLSESGSAPALAWLNEKFGVAQGGNGGMVGDSVQIIHTTIDGKSAGSRMVDREGKCWRLSEVLDAYLSECVAAQGQTPGAALLKAVNDAYDAVVNYKIPYIKGQMDHSVNKAAYELWCVISELKRVAGLRGGSPARSHDYHPDYVEAVEKIGRLEAQLAARSGEAQEFNRDLIIGKIASDLCRKLNVEDRQGWHWNAFIEILEAALGSLPSPAPQTFNEGAAIRAKLNLISEAPYRLVEIKIAKLREDARRKEIPSDGKCPKCTKSDFFVECAHCEFEERMSSGQAAEFFALRPSLPSSGPRPEEGYIGPKMTPNPVIIPSTKSVPPGEEKSKQ